MKECIKYNYVGILPLKIRVGLNSKKMFNYEEYWVLSYQICFPFYSYTLKP